MDKRLETNNGMFQHHLKEDVHSYGADVLNLWFAQELLIRLRNLLKKQRNRARLRMRTGWLSYRRTNLRKLLHI